MTKSLSIALRILPRWLLSCNSPGFFWLHPQLKGISYWGKITPIVCRSPHDCCTIQSAFERLPYEEHEHWTLLYFSQFSWLWNNFTQHSNLMRMTINFFIKRYMLKSVRVITNHIDKHGLLAKIESILRAKFFIFRSVNIEAFRNLSRGTFRLILQLTQYEHFHWHHFIYNIIFNG